MQQPKEFHLLKDSLLCILDDDVLILDLWKFFLKNSPLKVRYFTTPQEFIDFANAPKEQSIFLFTDYDLKNTLNGLDVVEKLNLKKSSWVITGQADDYRILMRAKELGVPVLAKDEIWEVKFFID